MRDKIKEWGKSANAAGGTVALPGRHCWRASVLRAALYSENFLSTYNLDYESIKLVKKGDSNIPVRNGRARAVLWCRCIRQVIGRVGWRCIWSNPGVPGSAHTGTLQWLASTSSNSPHLHTPSCGPSDLPPHLFPPIYCSPVTPRACNYNSWHVLWL